jgi:dTDP-4-amino-4,6-dideoxygalactose transaminase
MGRIAEICKERGLPLIEDAACAIGSSENGQRCGAIADMTCFSFHPRKLLTTGEGGAITINNPDWVDWFNRKLSHGSQGMLGYGLDFVDFGYNFRLSEPQAVMGRVQLQKLDDIVAERNLVRDAYINKLTKIGYKEQYVGENVIFNVQSLVFTVPEKVDRDKLIKYLRVCDIESTIGTYAMSDATYFKSKYDNIQKNSLFLQKNTITLPCYSSVDVELIIDKIVGYTKKINFK